MEQQHQTRQIWHTEESAVIACRVTAERQRYFDGSHTWDIYPEDVESQWKYALILNRFGRTQEQWNAEYELRLAMPETYIYTPPVTFEVVGPAEIYVEFSDTFSTYMTMRLRRNDGVEGIVCVYGGVRPDSLNVQDFYDVWTVGDCLQDWCPPEFYPEEGKGSQDRAKELYKAVLDAVRDKAIEVHRRQRREQASEGTDTER